MDNISLVSKTVSDIILGDGVGTGNGGSHVGESQVVGRRSTSNFFQQRERKMVENRYLFIKVSPNKRDAQLGEFRI